MTSDTIEPFVTTRLHALSLASGQIFTKLSYKPSRRKALECFCQCRVGLLGPTATRSRMKRRRCLKDQDGRLDKGK